MMSKKWETWGERVAREAAERNAAEDARSLARNVWLIWATERPGKHCTHFATEKRHAELLGNVHLDYPKGGVSSMPISGTVGSLIAGVKTTTWRGLGRDDLVRITFPRSCTWIGPLGPGDPVETGRASITFTTTSSGWDAVEAEMEKRRPTSKPHTKGALTRAIQKIQASRRSQ